MLWQRSTGGVRRGDLSTTMNKTNAKKLLSDADIFAQHIVSTIDCLDQSSAMDRIFSDPKHLGAYREAPHFYRTAYLVMLF